MLTYEPAPSDARWRDYTAAYVLWWHMVRSGAAGRQLDAITTCIDVRLLAATEVRTSAATNCTALQARKLTKVCLAHTPLLQPFCCWNGNFSRFQLQRWQARQCLSKGIA